MIYDSSESFSKASCSLSNQALQEEEMRLVDYVPVLPIALSHALSRPVPFSKFECLLSAQAVFGMRSLQIKRAYRSSPSFYVGSIMKEA